MRRYSTAIRVTTIWLLVALSTTFSTVQAQDVDVQASVSESTIGTEETVVYSITIEGSDGSNVAAPSPPDTEGLRLLQTVPGRSTSVSIVNGNVSRSISFNWTYRPLREGEAHIESATVTVGSESFSTAPLTVTIVAQSERPARQPQRRDPFGSIFSRQQPAEPPAPPDESDIFIRVIPSAKTAYRNEQITVQYRLFFRDGIQLRQSRLTDSWDAEGFWREELDVDTRPVPQVVVENGLRYNTIILKRAALFPTRAGELTVDPLRIESEAMVPSSRDPFQSFFARRSRFSPVELSSPPVEINTEPLPDGGPTSFSGAVGSFQMSANVDRTNLDIGESLQLILRITGRGNIATLDAPQLNLPAALEQYDPRVESSLDRSGAELRGSKTFTWVIIPRSNGTFEIDPIEFSWFDPGSRRYRTTSAGPFQITVTGQANVPASVTATTNGLPVDDFAPAFETASNWTRQRSAPLHTRWWAYLLVALPVTVLGAALVLHRHRNRLSSDISWARRRRAHPLSRKHLRRAAELLDSDRTPAFFEELERAVLGFIGNRLNIAERGLTREQLTSLLRQRGITTDIQTRLLNLLDHCDRGRYAPSSETLADLDEALDEASDLIPEIDEQIG